MKKALFLYVLVLFSALPALADMGPKPAMHFSIRYTGTRADHFVRLIQLEYDSLQSTVPADSLHDATHRGPEGLNCLNAQDCRSMAYGYSPYQRLMFVFTDDTLYSEIFEKQAFHSTYNVTVNDDKIVMENTTPWFLKEVDPYTFFRALLITLLVESLALLLVLSIFKYPHKFKFWVAVFLANLISLPIFWYGIMGLFNSTWGWFLGEAFVVLFESLFVWYFLRKPGPLGRIALLMLFLNFLSVMAGGAALFFTLLFS